MKAPKNFEAIFLAAAVLLNITAFATADETIVARPAATAQAFAAAGTTQVVIITAKRLSAAEKAALN
ncbi:MAG TPA: hypothetical protein VFI81_02665 [Rhodanobacteraceae bacterium]|nr:hypothetical protein [Rhodanobacteraceae bacterium]